MKKMGELLPTKLGETSSLELPNWLLAKREVVIKKYGTAHEFAVSFNPDIQVKCAANVERSLTGEAPTVRHLLATYTHEQMSVWLMGHFENLNIFVGVKSKMEYEQMKMLADIILTEYPYLKASEILLFFFYFKGGKFGELYGSVDPLKVTVALQSFMQWRARELDKIEQKRREEKRIADMENSKANAITKGRFIRRKFHRLGLKHKINKK